MLNRLKQRRESGFTIPASQRGFTIIEVMIVLAIAGLILLIVFLAVPALQRSSRNTSRKNDVSSLVSAISEYVSNNNGSLPTTSGQFTTVFPGENPKLSYYTTAANIQYNYSSSVLSSAPADPNSPDKVNIYNGATCSGNTASVSGASLRTVAILYDIESSSGNAEQCVTAG